MGAIPILVCTEKGVFPKVATDHQSLKREENRVRSDLNWPTPGRWMLALPRRLLVLGDGCSHCLTVLVHLAINPEHQDWPTGGMLRAFEEARAYLRDSLGVSDLAGPICDGEGHTAHDWEAWREGDPW